MVRHAFVPIRTPSGKIEGVSKFIGAFFLAIIAMGMLLGTYSAIGESIIKKERGAGCPITGEGIIERAASGNLITPILSAMEGPMRGVSATIANALEDMKDMLGSARIVFIVVGAILIIGGILLALPTLGGSFVGIGVGVVFLGGIVLVPGIGMHLAYEETKEIVDLAEMAFRDFAGDEEFLNAEMISSCASVIVLEMPPQDVSLALAEEIDSCLKMGREAGGFRICRDAIYIAKPPEDFEAFATKGRFLEETNECSVTFMLGLFYEWGKGGKSNSKCECDESMGWECERDCCYDPAQFFMKVYSAEGGGDVSSEEVVSELNRMNEIRQMGENMVLWDTKLCGDGKIEEDEVCIIEMFYGFDGKVHVRMKL